MAFAFSKTALLLLSLGGCLTLWGFSYTNGLLQILTEHCEPAAQQLSTTGPKRTVYTGIGPVDGQLTTLITFFYTAIDGNRPDVSMVGLDFVGQIIATWMLMVLESLRKGNRGKLLTWVTILGFLMQYVGFAIFAPLWMVLQLAQSPTVDGEKAQDLLADPVQVTLAPISLVIGYILPSVFMCLAAPTKITFETKDTWTAIQQGWPLWIYLSQHVLTFITQISSSYDTGFNEENIPLIRRRLRLAYGFALVSSATGHLTSWFLSLLAYIFPIIFNPSFARALQPSHVFLPEPPLPSTKAANLGDGALWFLQWDNTIGTASVLLWALSLRFTARRQEPTSLQWTRDIALAILASCFVGPAGCAVIAMWSRDEMVFKRHLAKKER